MSFIVYSPCVRQVDLLVAGPPAEARLQCAPGAVGPQPSPRGRARQGDRAVNGTSPSFTVPGECPNIMAFSLLNAR